MYPEERLGMHLNSASMLWERVEMLFQGVRNVMRDDGRARSGSFTMEWSASLHAFWKVTALNTQLDSETSNNFVSFLTFLTDAYTS